MNSGALWSQAKLKKSFFYVAIGSNIFWILARKSMSLNSVKFVLNSSVSIFEKSYLGKLQTALTRMSAIW